ncbi:hypothetical protein BASA50_010105 [Batrachochytrium salamandrivorans]|uniref:Protein MGR2 homolog n=1 Tax=Batrachochytrium salamandrivorans TaxID=1357716 RepID=A0ABQ8EZF0_9FUNG|nr:hypothetical protein BASA50_010105 [Batrachochytrium salamandrivorans]KAH9251480.1 hypothetical protein BASA81_010646 [Batrachochytrium salamandrivorans]KAH9268111.1 hypothetical protein BASA83_009502 [Batrachochytrium salamandrivorans]
MGMGMGMGPGWRFGLKLIIGAGLGLGIGISIRSFQDQKLQATIMQGKNISAGVAGSKSILDRLESSSK